MVVPSPSLSLETDSGSQQSGQPLGSRLVSERPDHQLQQPEGPWICASVLQFCKHSAISGFSTVSFGFTNYLGGQNEATVASHCSRRHAGKARRGFIPEPPSLSVLFFFPTPDNRSSQIQEVNVLGECLQVSLHPLPRPRILPFALRNSWFITRTIPHIFSLFSVSFNFLL